MRPTVIVFAKAPVAGHVKTRLGVESAERLHAAFVLDTLDKVRALEDEAGVEVHCDREQAPWRVDRLQCEGNLGRRMLAALDRLPALILGSDAPSLPLSHIRTLLASSADVTLGPAEDGGYYAIFCRRTEESMFDGVEWSTGRTLDQTIVAARLAGLSVELGPPWYDVDTPEDLRRLAREPGLPRRTARILESLGIRDNRR